MSPATRINLALAILLGVLIAAHWAVPPTSTQRNFHFFPDMVDSVAHEAQAPAPLLGSGKAVDLRPPEGSIARGYLPLPYEATPEGAALAGLELSSPLAEGGATAGGATAGGATAGGATAGDVAAAVERGGVVFATFCVTCHGAGGEGDGPVTRRGVPPPPSLLLPHALELADGQMYHIITFGQGNMAGYAAQVGRADRWNVIAYLRTLQAPAAAQAAAPVEQTGAEAEETPADETPAETTPVAEETTRLEETNRVAEEATP